MECVPAARAVVLNAVVPPAFNETFPRLFVPSKNLIEPAGTTLPDCGTTLAVKVTLCPLLMVVAEEARTVLVGTTADVMVTVTGCEVEPASLESPP